MEPPTTNFYNILGVSQDATQEQIKKARDKLALKYHPDLAGKQFEEKMKFINLAFEALYDSKKRNDYDCDTDFSDDPVTKDMADRLRLHVGKKWSDEFIEKINFWMGTGGSKDKTKFNDPNAEYHVNSISSKPIVDAFSQLLNSSVSSIQQILQSILPKTIWDWSFAKISIRNKEILNSKMWDEVSSFQTMKILPANLENTSIDKEVDQLTKTPPEIFKYPKGVGALKRKIYPTSNESNSIFPPSPQPTGTSIPLFPNTFEMFSAFGITPLHVVKGNKVQEIDAPNCSGCGNSFGVFLWKYNCVSCGNSFCDNCTKMEKAPDYVEPAPVCSGCSKENLKEIGKDWIATLEDPYYRQRITSSYLAFIQSMDFATSADYVKWADLFYNEGRDDLAIQCTVAGQGNFLALAGKILLKHQQRITSEEKTTNRRKPTVNVKSIALAKGLLELVKINNHQWLALGDKFAIENPSLAVLCYQKAGLTHANYIEKMIQFKGHPMANYCHSLANNVTPQNHSEADFKRAMEKKEFGLALSFAIRGKFTQAKWIEIINTLDMSLVEPFIEQFSKLYDVKKVTFNPDRDHFRWPFLSKPDFHVWLGYLEQLLAKGGGVNCISYFREKMKDENFIVHRDQFAASGDYSKMLLCHCLSTNRISWEDLGKKMMKTNKTASLAAYLCCSNDLEKLGDDYKKTEICFSIRCYLQIGNYKKIQELVPTASPNTKLLCLTVLLKKDPNNIENILAICRELKKNPSHLQSIKDILIGCLRGLNQKDRIPYYKLLVEIGISDNELLGLVESCSKLNLNAVDKLWYDKTLAQLRTNFKVKLYTAIQQYSFEQVFALSEMIHPLTQPILNTALKNLKIDEMPCNPLRSVCLMLRILSILSDPYSESKLFAVMNDLTSAMLGDPKEDSMKYYSIVMDKLSAFTKGDWKLRGVDMNNILTPGDIEFPDKLERNVDLKVLFMHHKAVKKLHPFDAAMSHIDVCMAVRNAPGMVGSFLTAAQELLKILQKSSFNSNEAYAYRKAILEIVATAYTIGNQNLCPATKLYMLRAGIAILTTAFKKTHFIGEHDQIVLDQLYREADHLSKVVPLVMSRLMQTYDLIYLDLIYRKIVSDYLDGKRKSDPDPIYQYYILEGSLGWMDQEKYKFETERVNTMQALLQSKGNTMEQVEELMSWPAIPRDKDGWLPNKPMPLNLNGKQKYNRVDGIRFDTNTGAISFLLGEANSAADALFDENDVSDIMKMGVSSAFFSLEPPDDDMHYHPFQKMVYAPKSLKGTNYLATMLHADMVMKWLSMGTEVSGMAPFALRDADEGLYLRLPEKLRKKFIDLKNNIPETAGRVHRFWIEAGDMIYYERNEEGEITIFVDDIKMRVNQRLMVRDQFGKLIDAEIDDETDSKEAKFAKLMTDDYDTVGKAYPEFLRLKELAKLQALSLFAQSVYKNLQESSRTISLSWDKTENLLNDLRLQVEYPMTDEVEFIVNERIRNAGYTPSWYEIDQLKNMVIQHCQEQDNSTVNQIASLLKRDFHIQDPLEDDVRRWLNTSNKTILIDTLLSSLELHLSQKILTVCNTMNLYGIASKPVKSKATDKCLWVPAAFKIDDTYRVYGGVNMGTSLIPGGAIERSMGNNSLPPKHGGSNGGPNARPYYIEGMGNNGRLYGTMVGVDRVTGNTYRIVDVKSCIRDQYNSHSLQPNVAAYWGTYVGYTNVHHYTRHTGGSTHFHYTNGIATCTNAQGQTTSYNSGDRRHRC